MGALAIFMIVLIVPSILCQPAANRRKHPSQNGQHRLLSRFLYEGGVKLTCGMRPRPFANYIVGGKESKSNSWPWQVAMLKSGVGFYCGGSLVHNKKGELVVITAAHCVEGSSPSDWTIQLGKHSLSTLEPQSKNVNVTKIHIHPSYSKKTDQNDIAVMILEENKFAQQDKISPVCLTSTKPSKFVGKSCFVTGWGELSLGGASPDRLQEVAMQLQTQDQCSQLIGQRFDKKTMLCAGDIQNGGIDSCRGDSGGPLVCRESSDSPYDLVGIVSWGYGCGRKNSPGIYTNVYNYLQWLDINME